MLIGVPVGTHWFLGWYIRFSLTSPLLAALEDIVLDVRSLTCSLYEELNISLCSLGRFVVRDV